MADPTQVADDFGGISVGAAKPPATRDEMIEQAAANHGVPANLLRAQIHVESRGRSDAVSPKGALGVMQIMPGTAKELGVTDPRDDAQAIDGGARYLAQQFKTFGSWPLALAAYNAGPGAVKHAGGIPDNDEVQNYVPLVMGKFHELEPKPNEVQDDFGGIAVEQPQPEKPQPYSPEVSPDTAAARAQFAGAAKAGVAPAALFQDTTDAAIAGAPELDAGPVPAPTPDQERTAELLHFAARSGVAMTPEKLADVKRIAVATGFSADYVAQHYDGPQGFGKEYQGKPFTFWTALAEKSPALSQFLLENPLDHALLKEGGLSEMSAMEWWLTGRIDAPATVGGGPLATGSWQPPALIQRIQTLLPAEKLAWKKAQRAGAAVELSDENRRADQIASGAVGLPLPPEEAARLALSGAAPPPPQSGAADAPFLAGLDQQIAEMEQGVPQRIDYGPQGRSILGRIVLSTIDLAPYMAEASVVGAASTLATGSPIPGLLAFNFARGAGETSAAAREEGMKGREAQEFGALGGILEAPLYTFGLSQLVPKLSLGKGVAEELVARTAAAALARETVVQAMGKAVFHAGEHAAMGAGSMGLAAGVSRLHLELGRAEMDPTHPIDLDAAVTEAVETALRTTVDLAGLSVLGMGGAMLRYVGARRATAAGLAQLSAFGDSARAAEHLGVPEEVAQRFVQGVRDTYKLQPNEAPEAALFDIGGWQRYWQGEKVDPREVAAKLGVADSYDQALAVGSDGFLDIPLPLARKLAAAEGGKHWAALLPDMKLSRRPEVATPRQQAEMDKADQARAKEYAKLEPDEMETSQRLVFKAARDLALDGGVPLKVATQDAKLEAAKYRRLAERLGRGESAWDIYDLYERHASGPQTAIRAALEHASAEYDVHPAARALTMVGAGEKAPAAKQEPAGEAPPPPAPVAPPPPERAAAPKGAPAAAKSEGSGAATRVITPQNREGEPAEYRWIPRANVQASHLPRQGFGKNPAYPEGVQERAYHSDQTEQRKVIEGARKFKASLVLSNNETPGDGPPLVTEAGANGEHLVLGGNSRRMMMEDALGRPETEAEYLDLARKQAALYGIDPATMTEGGMLARVVPGLTSESPKAELVGAVKRYNETLTQSLEARARGVSEGKNVTPEVAREIGQLLARHPDASLRDIMRDSPGALVEPLRRSGLIHDTNEGEWVRAGELVPEGKERIEAMLLGRILGDVDRWNKTPPSLTAKLERVAPELIQAASTLPLADEIPTVRAALDLLARAREKGNSLDEQIRQYAQADIFSRQTETAPDAAVLAMARLLDGEKPKALQARFQKWAQAIEGDLFAPAVRTQEDARRVLLGDRLNQLRLATGGEPWKLDRAAVEEMVGPELAKRLEFATAENGIPPDVLAREVGHESGQGLLHDMLARQDRQAWIEARAESMRDRAAAAQNLDPALTQAMIEARANLRAIRDAHPDDYNLFPEWREAHERFLALRRAADAGGGVPDWYFQQARAPAEPEPRLPAGVVAEGALEPGPLWHSALERAAVAAKQAKGTADSWLAVLSKTPGVKAEEIEETGLREWLKEQKGTVSREQVSEFIRAHRVEVTERVLGGGLEEQRRADELRALIRSMPPVDYKDPFQIAAATLASAGSQDAARTFLMGRIVETKEWLKERAGQPAAEYLRKDLDSLGAAYNRVESLTPEELEPFQRRAAAEKELGGLVDAQGVAPRPMYEGWVLGAHREGTYRELLFYTPKSEGFESQHFKANGQGLLAHARLSEHVGSDGKAVLMVEEIQSDLHQQGREKGYAPGDATEQIERLRSEDRKNNDEAYRLLDEDAGYDAKGDVAGEPLANDDPRHIEIKRRVEEINKRRLEIADEVHRLDTSVADAPWKESWEALIARRLVRWAAEHGYDKLAWAPGEVQAKRYELSQQVEKLSWERGPTPDGETVYSLRAYHHNGGLIRGLDGLYKAEELPGIVGKEIAKRIVESKEHSDTIRGEGLAVGGEGMRIAYDKRIPGIFEKIIKKWGGKVGKEQIDPGYYPDFYPGAKGGFEVWTATLPLQLRAEVLANGMPLFQVNRQGPRGYVEFSAGKGSKVRADIHHLFGSDASTHAHESMHVFSKILGDVAQRADAPADIKADYDRLLKEMGYADHAERVKAPDAAKEEKVTHLWEMYLAEGKAPSIALRGAFQRFKGWWLNIYRQVAGDENGAEGVAAQYEALYGEKLVLSDDVRRIFDRLLASETEAERIAQEFDVPIAAAFTEQERQEDARLASESQSLTADAIVKLAAADDASDAQQAAHAEGERIKAAVKKNLADSDPGYKVLALLQDGEIPGAEALKDFLKGKDGQPAKLDRAATVALIGAEATRALPKGIFARGKNGVTPDDLAQRLALPGGRELLAAIQGKDFPGAVTDAITQHNTDRFGAALLQNPEQLRAAALDGFHNEAALKRIFLRLSAMARELGPKAQRRLSAMKPSDMRSLADKTLLTKVIRSISADAYANKEAGAARRAVELYEAGKKEKAWDEAEAQAWNHVFSRAARDLRSTVESAFALVRGARADGWRAELGKAWVEEAAADGTMRQVYPHREVTEAILRALGMGDGGEKPIAEQLETLRLLETFTESSGHALGFDVDAIRDLLANPTRWSDLTAEAALNARNAIDSLHGLAKRVNTMELEGRRIERAAVIDRFRVAGEKNLPEQPKFPDDPLLGHGFLRAARRLGQEIDGNLVDIATLAHLWDGGDRDGIFHLVFIDQEHACRAKRDELMRTVLKDIVAKFEKSGISRSRLFEKLEVNLPLSPELARTRTGDVRTRANLLLMLLNLGNESNEERFLGGYKWSRQQVEREIGKNFTREEILWAQDVWDVIEKLYPEMAKVHADEEGIAPEKIKAKPFDITLASGEVVHLEGGYFPARYDARPGTPRRTGEKQVAEEVSQFLQRGFDTAPATRSTHAKKRAAHFEDVMNLDWSVVPAHLAQVIHDTTYRPWVRQTAALLLNRDMHNLLIQRLGEQRASQLRPWLRAVANRTSDAAPENLRHVDRAWSWARSKAAVSALGWSFSRALGDLSDPTIAVAAGYVRPDYLARASLEFASSPREMMKFVFDNCLEARQRVDHVGHRFTAEIGLMGGRSGMQNPLLRVLHETAFVTEEMVDRLVIPPTFMARYRQSMAEYRAQGMTEEEAHTKAARDGGDVIRKILPPMDMADKPALIRDRRGLGGLLLFYGHANKVGNIFRRRAADLARTWRDGDASGTSKASELAKLLGTTIAITAANGLLAEWLTGRGKEEGEDEADWVLRKSVSQLLYPVPFGSVAEAGIRMVTGDSRQVSIRNAPQLGLAQDLWNNLGTWGKAFVDGDAGAEPKIAAALEIALAVAAGAPTRQAHKTVGYLSNLAQGATDARGPLDVASGITFGESNANPSNPFTDAQDVISGGQR